jgi:hypothetical protein
VVNEDERRVRSQLARTLRAWAHAVDSPEDGDDHPGASPSDRSGVALSLLDDECLGYFVLQVRDGEPTPEVWVGGDCDPQYWQAVGTTLHRAAREAYGVRG